VVGSKSTKNRSLQTTCVVSRARACSLEVSIGFHRGISSSLRVNQRTSTLTRVRIWRTNPTRQSLQKLFHRLTQQQELVVHSEKQHCCVSSDPCRTQQQELVVHSKKQHCCVSSDPGRDSKINSLNNFPSLRRDLMSKVF
jgi:hypothetical protein